MGLSLGVVISPITPIPDGCEPYDHSAQFSLSHLRSPTSSPSLHNHRSYHSSASMMSTSTISKSISPSITPARYANNLRTLSQTKPSRPLRGPKLFFTPSKARTGIGGIWIRHPPYRDAVEMGRGSRDWPRCWKWQHCSSC